MHESTKHLKYQLDAQRTNIENSLDMDVLSIIGPIMSGLENVVKEAIEKIPEKKKKIAIIHNTSGGIVEVVERMVNIVRHHYDEVIFIIPDRAMSAGTVFALSGDKIYMNYFSCLGPIDPQVERNIDGQKRLVPALSYINQYNKFIQNAQQNNISSVEFSLFKEQFNLAELETFMQAQELTEDLLEKWLATYKFKDWKKENKEKKQRAKKIAKDLNNYKKWHSHSRGISKETLKSSGLKINDFSEIEGLTELVNDYYGLLTDFMQNEKTEFFVHGKGYLFN